MYEAIHCGYQHELNVCPFIHDRHSVFLLIAILQVCCPLNSLKAACWLVLLQAVQVLVFEWTWVSGYGQWCYNPHSKWLESQSRAQANNQCQDCWAGIRSQRACGCIVCCFKKISWPKNLPRWFSPHADHLPFSRAQRSFIPFDFLSFVDYTLWCSSSHRAIAPSLGNDLWALHNLHFGLTSVGCSHSSIIFIINLS